MLDKQVAKELEASSNAIYFHLNDIEKNLPNDAEYTEFYNLFDAMYLRWALFDNALCNEHAEWREE